MKIDIDQFMDQGFLILRNFIAVDKLESLRTSCDIALERQKAFWAQERGPDDPSGGKYEKVRQPRVHMEIPGIIDEETSNIIEDFWVADDTLDTATQLLCNPEPSVSSMMMMCNPVRDWPGGTGYHRDVHPIDMAPLDALVADFLENGPRYTQWNVPMYDDNVLWVVPGSHRRRNTEQENARFFDDLKPHIDTAYTHLQYTEGGVPVDLKAGDAVVYSNFLLHTGSTYTTKKRRTLHGGHAIFSDYPEFGFTESLFPKARATFETFARRGEQKKNATEASLRAVIARDSDAYRTAVESIQPGAGRSGKTVIAIYLCKAALHMRALKDPDFVATEDTKRRASGSHNISLNWGPDFADRFSFDESRILWERFKPLDAKLSSDIEMFEPAFQSRPMYYYFNELPEGADAESWIASWSNGT